MSIDSVELLEQKVAAVWPVDRWAGFHVVIAVSGGADSVGLLRTLVRMRQKFASDSKASGSLVAAHFNHKGRGEDSELDAAFVKQLANRHGLPFHLGEASEEGTSKSENDLREDRYSFLIDVARTQY